MSAETMLHRLRLFLLALALLIFAGTVVELWFTEHIEHNLAFELEFRPNATAAEVFMDALGGANPLLAPGILALAAVLALAATYYQPILLETWSIGDSQHSLVIFSNEFYKYFLYYHIFTG